MQSSRTTIVILLLAAWLFYLLCLMIYRLILSPLCKLPGPKLAALTGWYEVYYDLVQPAMFPWKIQELHQRYGPIIRISPDEVHISDPEYASTHFSATAKMNRYAPHRHMFGTPEATLNTIERDHHKLRRSALNRMFSKRQIFALEPIVTEKVEKCSSRLKEFKQTGQVVDLRLLLTCLTLDVITEFTLARSYDRLSTADLSPTWAKTFSSALKNTHWFRHWPFLWNIVRSTPQNLITFFNPDFQLVLNFEGDIKKQVAEVMNGDRFDDDKLSHPIIFRELLQSNLPPAEKTHERLWQEGQSLVGAGTETTSNTLCYAFVSLLTRPEKLQRLKAELLGADPIIGKSMSLLALEQLPYLTAVIAESLRLSIGVTSRIIRVSPDLPVTYKDYTLPPGTPVGMSALVQHANPDIFPEPTVFMPERWLDGQTSKDDLLTFSKGPRSCVGQNLAYAELYLTLGTVLTRYNFELFETSMQDVDPMEDGFVAMPRTGSKGVRVTVH